MRLSQDFDFGSRASLDSAFARRNASPVGPTDFTGFCGPTFRQPRLRNPGFTHLRKARAKDSLRRQRRQDEGKDSNENNHLARVSLARCPNPRKLTQVSSAGYRRPRTKGRKDDRAPIAMPLKWSRQRNEEATPPSVRATDAPRPSPTPSGKGAPDRSPRGAKSSVSMPRSTDELGVALAVSLN